MTKMFQEFLVSYFEINSRSISFLKKSICYHPHGVKYALFQRYFLGNKAEYIATCLKELFSHQKRVVCSQKQLAQGHFMDDKKRLL